MHEAIAILGMGLRFPGGANSPEAFWRLLMEGREAVTEIQPERWSLDRFYHPRPGIPGKHYTKAAGQLDDIQGFDANFFGISPREAGQIDPQQKLLLEMAWEAMEDAGLPPSSLKGSNTGVFVGISSTDFANNHFDDPAAGNAYFMTGSTLSIAANRLSYVFDLHGPSMAIDTACSSSLVALHQACQGLWAGSCDLALCGGINILLSPFPFIGFSQASMLSPDGRCKAFDASGRGYVRSEGGAVVILKPLSAALRDGDWIRAVIHGVGTNCDGRTAGVSLPSAQTQEALLRDVYSQAGIPPGRLCYLEAHGTGTAAGDPVETEAIGRAIGHFRPKDSPLLIGSVKTNIGHLESASGMAGLIKAILCLQQRTVPASRHFSTPNPNIPFEDLHLRVVTEPTPLESAEGPLRIGVNSFGFGGANAHVVLGEFIAEQREAEPPTTDETPGLAGYPLPLLLSARSETALRQLAGHYLQLLADPALAYPEIARALVFRREQHTHRLAVIGKDPAEISVALEAFASGGSQKGICQARCHPGLGRTVAVFSGNGCQWHGMGQGLYAADARFRYWLRQVDGVLAPLTGWSVIEELFVDATQSRLVMTEVAQPLLFALQVALWECLRERGLGFAATLGHSVGEVAAAYAAGILDLEQAARVIFERSRLQGLTRGKGRMAAVNLSLAAAEQELGAFGGRLEVAGINSPVSLSLSGPLEDLEALGESLTERKIFYRLLELDYAFHSRVLDPIQPELETVLAGLKPRPARIPFISTVTGEERRGPELKADYWWDNVRQPVRFQAAVSRLAEQGHEVFLEIGPHAILQYYINDSLRALEAKSVSLGLLDRKEPEVERLAHSLGWIYVHGGALDWRRLYGDPTPLKLPLPLYPWQREPHGYQATVEALGYLHRTSEHPFLGWRQAGRGLEWESLMDTALFPWLGDHRVGGAVLFPAAGFAEMALAAGAALYGETTPALERLEILRPLELSPNQPRVIQTRIKDEIGSFEIASRGYLEAAGWNIHAWGRLLRGHQVMASPPAPAVHPGPNQPGRQGLDHQGLYRIAQGLGLEYGPSFQCVEEIWNDGDWAWARLLPPPEAAGAGWRLHPSSLDGAFQTLLAVLAQTGLKAEEGVFLPTSLGSTRLLCPGLTASYAVTRLLRQGKRSVVAEFWLLAEDLTPIAHLAEARFRRMEWPSARSLPALYRMQSILCDPPLGETPAFAGEAAALWSALKTALEAVPRQGLERYRTRILPRLEALIGAFVHRSLHALFDLEGRFDLGAFPVERQAWIEDLLRIGVEDGFIERRPEGWSWNPSGLLPTQSPEVLWSQLLGDCPELLPELVQIGRCGRHLPAWLSGERVAEPRLASSASAVSAQMQDQSMSWAGVHLALAAAIRAFVAAWRSPRRLRVLHLGPPQAESVPQLLPLLPDDGFDFVYATRDEALLSAIEGACRHGQTDRSPKLSGWALGAESFPDPVQYQHSFDLILVWNLADWDEDVGDLLSWLSQIASPRAWLLIAAQAPTRYTRFLAGAQAGWWSRIPTGSWPLSQAGDPEQWRARLDEYGYDSHLLLTPAQLPLGNAFLLAARPAMVPETLSMPLTAEDSGRYLLLLSDGNHFGQGLAQTLAAKLRSRGDRVKHILVPTTGERIQGSMADGTGLLAAAGVEDFRAALEDMKLGEPHSRVVVSLLGLPASLDQEAEDPARDLEPASLALLHLVQALAELGGEMVPHLVLVTAGAFRGPDQTAISSGRPSQWALAGLRRVIANEHKAWQCRLIDLQGEAPLDLMAEGLVRELAARDGEDEIILRGAYRYGLRLRPLASESLSRRIGPTDPGTGAARDESAPYRLDFVRQGSLDNLEWQPLELAPIESDEIEVEVRAAGLNFRDVMWAMGLLQDEAVEDGFAGPTLGMECAGVVVALGAGVRDFRVGDAVLCFAPSCFASRVRARTTATALQPKTLSFAEAATIPSAFFTVYYALHHLAQLQPGETILIHGAAGGVGLAAIQYARHIGARIFASAGTQEKRDVLHLLGVDRVFDSRSLDFADRILSDGEGVDVVLNSLAGEAIEQNLRILRPFGRFLELGKRDFYADSKIGLRPFRNNISYFGIDADQLMRRQPALARRLFRDMMALFESGALHPLPYRAFPFQRIREAFRTMQQSRHIGKLILLPQAEGEPLPVMDSEPPHIEIHPDAAYLIVGGLGGFGLATARWLAAKGARHLSLLGRSGVASEAAGATLAELRDQGVEVRVLQADVTDPSQLEPALERIRQAGRPLRGVLHAAMQLDDGMLRNLSAERFLRAMRPKVRGAWNLHQLTLEDPLDLFVLYSSATTYLGSAGQSNYVTANAYLEGLAAYRRRLGRPGLAVAWGAIGDVGVLARNETLRKSLAARTGFTAITADKALRTLDLLLGAGLDQCAVMDLDWGVIRNSLPSAAAARFSEVLVGASDSPKDALSFRERIAGLTVDQIKPLIIAALKELIGKVLRLPPDKVDPQLSLQDMGMDSLMSVELAIEIEKYFGIPFTSMSATAAGNLGETASRIAAALTQVEQVKV